jgi:NAD(P)-dependent dehydrogenase (short-subunit alcohol dehydrogenase family)
MLSSFPPGSKIFIQGASRGIGLEFVRQLAAHPQAATVFAGCRSPGTAARLRELAEESGRIRVLQLDVTDVRSIAAAAAQTGQATDRLHLLVNCAGVLHDAERGLGPEKKLDEVQPASLERSFAVNAFGPLLMAKHFRRLLMHDERAVFASISAKVGSIRDNRLGGWYSYRGSKAALNMFTRTLAIEWARSRRNLACVALHPGTTDTELSRPFQGGVPAERLFSAERSVRQLLQVVDGVTAEQSGSFLSWDGTALPW